MHGREPAFHRKHRNLSSLKNKHRPAQQEDCVSIPIYCFSECSLNIVATKYVNGLDLQSERFCRKFRVFQRLLVAGGVWSAHDGHAGEPRNDLLQQLQPLSTELIRKSGQPSNVSSRSRKASHEPRPNRVVIACHYNGNRSRCLLRGPGCCCTTGNDDINIETDQLRSKRRQAIGSTVCIAILNDNVFSL